MNVFSPEFLALFAIAVFFITMRARSKRGEQRTPMGKQIAIIGRKLETSLSRTTPYECLLADGRKFGDGYQDKDEPELPHNDNCQCQFSTFVRRNYDIFTKERDPDPPRPTDLGDLGNREARYYKYMLIASHPDAGQKDRETYLELADQVNVDQDFKRRVQDHLKRS